MTAERNPSDEKSTFRQLDQYFDRTGALNERFALKARGEVNFWFGIRRDRKKASEKLRAEDPGGTTLKSHDVRRDPAFRRNSVTLIMAFVSFAVVLSEHHLAKVAGAHWYDDAYELL